MLGEINTKFNRAKADKKNDQFIVESVIGEDEVLPGSEEELDDIVDSDSIPDDVMSKIDKAMDDVIGDGDIDDEEIDEMLDDDDDLDDTKFSELDAYINEAANAWYDDENVHHPDTSRRNGTKGQPLFRPTGGMV